MVWNEDVNRQPLDVGDFVHAVHHPAEIFEVLEINDSNRTIALWDETRSREMMTAVPSTYQITEKYDGSYPLPYAQGSKTNKKSSFIPPITPPKTVEVLTAGITHLIVQPGGKVTYYTSEASAIQVARELVDQDKICYVAELKYKIYSKTEVSIEAMAAKDHIPDIL